MGCVKNKCLDDDKNGCPEDCKYLEESNQFVCACLSASEILDKDGKTCIDSTEKDLCSVANGGMYLANDKRKCLKEPPTAEPPTTEAPVVPDVPVVETGAATACSKSDGKILLN